MKKRNCRQPGFTLVELAVVLIIIAIILGSILQSRVLTDRTTVLALVKEMRNTKIMMETYRSQFGALPGDDRAARTHVGGAIGGALHDALITTNYGWSSSATPWFGEPGLFWQHLRLAGLAGNDPATDETRNAVRGYLGIISSTARPTTPAGIPGLHAICSSGIEGSLAKMLDLEMDDGRGTSGVVFGAAQTNESPVETATPAAAYINGKLYTVCWAVG